jgi:hypothetical protein
MDVDPTNASAVKFVVPYEQDDLLIRNQACLLQLLVRVEQLGAAAAVAREELSEYKIVPNYLIAF